MWIQYEWHEYIFRQNVTKLHLANSEEWVCILTPQICQPVGLEMLLIYSGYLVCNTHQLSEAATAKHGFPTTSNTLQRV